MNIQKHSGLTGGQTILYNKRVERQTQVRVPIGNAISTAATPLLVQGWRR
jgi:hypothetical protein